MGSRTPDRLSGGAVSFDPPERGIREARLAGHSAQRHTSQTRGPSPLYRNGLALALSSALSGLLGAGFWVLAANSTPRAALGEATALVAALMALSMLGQLNLAPALTVFLPAAGSRRLRLVAGSYLTATAASALLGAAFAVGAPRLTDSFDSLASVPAAAAFAACVAMWSLFALQDAVLAGMRKAAWVPTENALYNIAKFGMLAALGGGTVWVLMGSWIVPATIAILPVTFLLFTRVLPTRVEPLPGSDGRTFRRFMAGESTAMAFDQLGVTLLPVLVVVALGPEVGAAFGVAWMTTTALDALVIGMGSSLVVEGSQPGADVRPMYRALRRRCLVVLGGVIAIGELGAPLFLHAFGKEYADDATAVFRLLMLASLPRALVILAMSAGRAERRISWVVKIHMALAALVPGGALVLGLSIGVEGVGLAWLGAHILVAAGILADEARRRGRVEGTGGPTSPLVPEPRLDSEATLVINRNRALSSVVPQHASLVDAPVTALLRPRYRQRDNDGTMPLPLRKRRTDS